LVKHKLKLTLKPVETNSVQLNHYYK